MHIFESMGIDCRGLRRDLFILYEETSSEANEGIIVVNTDDVGEQQQFCKCLAAVGKWGLLQGVLVHFGALWALYSGTGFLETAHPNSSSTELHIEGLPEISFDITRFSAHPRVV